MRYILTTLLLAAIATINPARAGELVNDNPGHEKAASKRSSMTTVAFGRHSKMIALPSERDRIRGFYRDVLGCKVTKESERAEYFQMADDFFIAVLYENSVLSQPDLLKSIWLEIQTDNTEELKQKILEFGVKVLDMGDKEHLYFQAPGGQVFRLVGKTEDLSRFEH